MEKEHADCLSCQYKNWDCKSCFLDLSEGWRTDMAFFFIMTPQCNFRCDYCALDFSDGSISQEVLDSFFRFIRKNGEKINNVRIEFFGWEPLMEFDKIRYVVENTKRYCDKFSIVTNGYYLTGEIIDFLNANDFEVVFSVSLHSRSILERKDLFKNKDLSKFAINFILEPGKEKFMYGIFKRLIEIGFRKISLIPVRYTKKWSKENLESLDLLLAKLKKLYDGLNSRGIPLDLFTGRNNSDLDRWIRKSDFEIVVGHDGKMYADYEVELYLMKDFVPKEVFDIREMQLGDIREEDADLSELLAKRNRMKPHYHINKIADHLDMDESDRGLGEVMVKYNVNV